MDTTVILRSPEAKDGAAIWQLVKETGALDLNSPYAYLLLGDHFAETCIVAERDHEIVGFVSAYVPPSMPSYVFVWQVGVANSARKQGLALTMLRELLGRDVFCDVRSLITTITPSNKASRALFTALARAVNGELREQEEHFPADWFPGADHEPESLFTISPLQLAQSK